MISDWRFADSQDTEVVTLERVLRGDSSLVLVTHDVEDGGWQFLDGEHVFEEDGATVLLGEIVQFDPSLLELADLPVGWYAWRAAPDRPWQRIQGEPTSTPDPPPIDLDSAARAARNIEIKAHVSDTDRLRNRQGDKRHGSGGLEPTGCFLRGGEGAAQTPDRERSPRRADSLLPESGRTSPPRTLISVDLPAPFSPTRSEKSTPPRAWTPPYRLVNTLPSLK